MGMIVQHNMNALNAYNKLNTNVAGLKKSSEKLSSGYRINRAGDDAAGLAISEKMRSQIRGLNQAKRNSQDGISMIQTFEGAAQETHSILQRMKELASESANGTYDNRTDRAAIQLEFNQLNDELNQIADTDFNGTIVLNGGVMADGLEVNDKNEFNYGERADQIAAADAAAAAAAAADKALADSAQDVIGGTRYTDSAGTAEAAKTTVVDNANYSATDANKIWEKLGLDASEVEQVDVTFAYDGKEWVAVSASNAKKGLEMDDTTGKFKLADDATAVKIDVTKEQLAALATSKKNGAGEAGNGGFSIKDTTVNAIFNSSETQKYDYLTITFQNKGGSNAIPQNIGIKESSWKATGTDKLDAMTAKPTVTAGTSLTVANMDENMKKALDAVKGATFTVAADGVIGLKTPIADAGGTGKAITVKANGDNYDVIFDEGTGKLNQTLFSITKPTLGANHTETFEFQIDFDSYAFVDTKGLTANSAATVDANKPKAGAFDSAEETAKSGGVSKADAFDKSDAILTYANNITLQVGARTKDAVNFTFEYNKDGTADMGELKANLNLSARADGLNTENLSLATAKDANYAIDQIDKAINKTSMVRASFGSIQNRLEHKIDNLTTTSENLTEAEAGIRDTDMAQEMMNYTKFNILQQAAQSMLAQANQQPQSILQLLG